MINLFYAFALLLLVGCVGNENKDSLNRSKNSKTSDKTEESLKIDPCTKFVGVIDCTQASEAEKKTCYFDNLKDKCFSKSELRAVEIAATKYWLLVATKDGHLYMQSAISGIGQISDTAKSVSARSDYFCYVKKDGVLVCKEPTSSSVPTLVANIKAKSVSVSLVDQSLCYIKEDDKVECAGTKKLDPRFGGGAVSDDMVKIASADYSAQKFADLKVGPKHACGRLATGEIACFKGEKEVLADFDFSLQILPAQVKGYAVGIDRTYFFEDKGINYVQNYAMPAITAINENFVMQGTKSADVDITNMTISDIAFGFYQKTSTSGISDVICVIAAGKVYCKTEDPAGKADIDLTSFNPQNPKKVHVAQNLVCAIESDDKLVCANILNEADDRRILGLEKTGN